VTDPRIRPAVRAIVLDPSDRVLLVRFEFPDLEVWATPGGGVDDDESHEQAIRRELLEEAGLDRVELGPVVWTRTHLQPFGQGRWDGQSERYYVVRAPAFEPTPRLTWEQLRLEGMTAVRWWGLDELEASDALFAPRRLPQLVRSLVRDGPPAEPVDVGI
jgi:ADP-ribose pyrophosphatase YjhB (NUDIX family)